MVGTKFIRGRSTTLGARKANLTGDIIVQFGYQEVGNLRAIKRTVTGFPSPLLNLRAENIYQRGGQCTWMPLMPPFDPYANTINYLLASYVIPYVGLTEYVGANPNLQSNTSKQLVTGLLGTESGQDAVIREYLYERAALEVHPYGITVAEFTNRISELRNRLGHAGLKDEGLVVPPPNGEDGKVTGNVLSGDQNSLSYARTPEETMRILYSTGDEHVPGGFSQKEHMVVLPDHTIRKPKFRLYSK
ncbi:desiccation-related protein PCC13-62-like [Quillaja saponaria]|uniref:Desiccation-related protein PCC13-62-like n=1 Tax=Quillaja saponaria TaxID=32244 RepID=A0AAD7LBX5_QUISA|nr:desiccation-related protein PCC13-62-like [Quillaja saponaria]